MSCSVFYYLVIPSQLSQQVIKARMEKILAEQAALELGAVDTNQILTLLECPVCLDHITPPIKQCIKGHLVCTDCFPHLPHCPT